MGTVSANWLGFWIHINPASGLEEFVCGYHHGAIGINSVSPGISVQAGWGIFAHVLSGDQVAFNAACAAAYGAWWTTTITSEMRAAAWTGERRRFACTGLY